MPFSVNGFGTDVCPAQAFVHWGGQQADFDGIECFVFCYLPIIPHRAIHAFGWQGNQYRKVAIKWRRSLFLKALLRRMGLFLILAILVCFAASIMEKVPRDIAITCGVLGFVLGLSLVGGLFFMWFSDRRERNIRYVLGPHDAGSSDPATWTKKMCKSLGDSKQMFGAKTFAAASRSLLRKGEFSQAMWAARLCLALEDEQEGQALTDLILRDPNVQTALAVVKKTPNRWQREMNAKKETRS